MTEKEARELMDTASLEDLQNGQFMYQHDSLFKFGIDAVLLSRFARVKKNERVLDAGCGTGILPLLLAARTNGKHFTGLEIQEKAALLARESVKYNSLEERIDIVAGDIRNASEIFGRDTFDVVVSNPPYMKKDDGKKSDNAAAALARHELECTFDDLCREISKVLKSRGRFYIVHRPYRIAELINTLSDYRLGLTRMRLVYPFIDREPQLVLLEAKKETSGDVKVEKPLIIYKKPGVYTGEVLGMYQMP